jgi:O-antigen ligase
MHSINVWLQNGKTILIGIGFDMTRIMQAPHNIYLEALHDMGLIGLITLLVLFASVFNAVLRIKVERIRFWALVIFFYISMGGLTYWHTKTLWVSIMFCLLLVSYDRYIRLKGETG